MSTPPTPIAKARRRDHDTGFPEPFNDNYNTTLPHPEADLSPNAVISSDHLSSEHVIKRRHLSMLTKHHRTMSQSSTSTTSQGIHSILPLIANLMPGVGDLVSSPTSLSGRGTLSVESIKEEDEDTPPTSLEVQDLEPERKRTSFIGKLRAKAKG